MSDTPLAAPSGNRRVDTRNSVSAARDEPRNRRSPRRISGGDAARSARRVARARHRRPGTPPSVIGEGASAPSWATRSTRSRKVLYNCCLVASHTRSGMRSGARSRPRDLHTRRLRARTSKTRVVETLAARHPRKCRETETPGPRNPQKLTRPARRHPGVLELVRRPSRTACADANRPPTEDGATGIAGAALDRRHERTITDLRIQSRGVAMTGPTRITTL